jgi:hypothetical protein
LAIHLSAELYFIYYCDWVFPHSERKNPNTDKTRYHAAAG